MMTIRSTVNVLFFACWMSLLGRAMGDGLADNQPETVRRIPQLGIEVPKEIESKLRTKLGALQHQIEELRKPEKKLAPDLAALLPDVLVLERAVRSALDYHEFFAEAEFDRASQLLDEGARRAKALASGDLSAWKSPGQLFVRGYISKLDQTVQPYGLVLPDAEVLNSGQPLRCDIWFHGRGETLSELNFVWDRMHRVGEYAPNNTIVLHPYGRYSNAFKFAGEVDVLEALEDVKRHYHLDEDRISVRGFSMGGAACWQFATHYSDRWFAANPGAGFAETPRFLKTFQGETLNPTPWQRKLWNLYDCDHYALNLNQCPTIAYSGEVDRQKQAADVMESALAEHHIRLRHVIGAGMAHKIDDASKKIIESDMKSLATRGRTPLRTQIHFETYTLKYNRMDWVTVTGLHEHWKRAHVDAKLSINTDKPAIAITIQTANTTGIQLDFPPGTFSDALMVPTVDVTVGETLIPVAGPTSDGALTIRLKRNAVGTWNAAEDSATGKKAADRSAVDRQATGGLHKSHDRQGPIDDALMNSFVFVRATGKSSHEALGKWSDSELERAIEHWRRHFRGEARVLNDVDVTQEIADNANLILWGDPASNVALGKIAKDLPIGWTAKEITVGEKSFPAANHAVILVYPNPMNPSRYVVLNSSFTFREFAYLNNARQVPMLPDWAIVNLDTPASTVDPGKVVLADFFNEAWQLKQ